MKFGEKQCTMLYSALSATLCACVMSDFQILHHFTRYINNGGIKIFVQNKIFSRPTQLSGPYVTGTKQIFLSSLE